MKLSSFFLIGWALIISFVLGTLMARHHFPFSTPAGLGDLVGFVAKNHVIDKDFMLGLHVLDPRCACSVEVVNFLSDPSLQGPQVQSVGHMVVLVADDDSLIPEELRKKLVGLHVMSPEEAKESFMIETVPWFVLMNNNAEILYSGGYSIGRIRDKMDVQIAKVIEGVTSGRDLDVLPVFGCATSQALRRKLLQFD